MISFEIDQLSSKFKYFHFQTENYELNQALKLFKEVNDPLLLASVALNGPLPENITDY